MSIKKLFLALLLIVGILVGVVYISNFKNSQVSSPIQQVIKQTISDDKTNCPVGFIFVKGDPTYKTSDFCVMKYDAKCTNPSPLCVTKEGVYQNDKPGCACQNNFQVESRATGAPITFIPEDGAVSAKSYCATGGYHLITNPEWMTIARNVEQVSSNWCNKDGTNCGNTPGTLGTILANGHNDSSPLIALPAGPDNEPCFDTTSDGSNICGKKSSQKRTLTLNSGEIIWDFAGNVWQWVDAKIERKDEPHTPKPAFGLKGSNWLWSEFSSVSYDNSYMPSNPNWGSKNGVGRIFHYNLAGDTDTTIYTYIRGGNWRHGGDSGAFTIHMQPVPGKENIDDIGFRCVSNPI